MIILTRREVKTLTQELSGWQCLDRIACNFQLQPLATYQSYRASDDIREWKNWPELTGAFRTRINLRDVDGNIKEEWMSAEIEAADTTWSGLMVCSTWRRGNGNFNIEGNCKTGFPQNLWTLQVSLSSNICSCIMGKIYLKVWPFAPVCVSAQNFLDRTEPFVTFLFSALKILPLVLYNFAFCICLLWKRVD